MQTFKKVEVEIVMAEAVVFHSEWVVQIKAMLHDDDDENCEANGMGLADHISNPILHLLLLLSTSLISDFKSTTLFVVLDWPLCVSFLLSTIYISCMFCQGLASLFLSPLL